MRLHIPSLPHTQTTKDYSFCAYSMKVVNLCNMLAARGHTVYLYAGEDNAAACTEHIPVVTHTEQRAWWPDYDARTDVWNGYDSSADWWQVMNRRVVKAIHQRAEPGDILGLIAGTCQRQIADAHADLTVVEWGIGYSGTFAPYRVFESYAWQHHMAGYDRADTFRPHDTVIPNSFEVDAFPQGAGGDHYVWMGRLIDRKGPQIAADVCGALGAELVMAGQGVIAEGPGWVEGIDCRVKGPLTHLGLLGPEDRAELLGGAKAVFVPTTYLEPFGGVAVEAMLCGTPVITTDYGAFTETVAHGVSGFRCRSMGEFVVAARQVETLDRDAVRAHALRYTTDNIAPLYERYLGGLPTRLPSDAEGA